jgi:DNA-binding transcriptional MerR regulator
MLRPAARPTTPEKPAWAAWWFGERGDGEGEEEGEAEEVEVVMPATLTVEPGCKSTGGMERVLATIGDVARRAGVATSTVRYYERRGLVWPDGRESGQRRYRPDTLRLLVFIGMLKDAGLSLDDIDGIVHAESKDEWKGIAERRLHALDEEIARLEHARGYLQGALLCRFDHPLTECSIMGAEIDRRLAAATPDDDRPDDQ